MRWPRQGLGHHVSLFDLDTEQSLDLDTQGQLPFLLFLVGHACRLLPFGRVQTPNTSQDTNMFIYKWVLKCFAVIFGRGNRVCDPFLFYDVSELL